MMDSPCYIKNVDIIPTTTPNHSAGLKKVLLSKVECTSNQTQVAVGFLSENTLIEPHKHATMEEFFFVTKGQGHFTIEKQRLSIEERSFVSVPANHLHSIEAITDLEFIYWSIGI
jgi:quercetin dioxygenase-like cupin family protein